MPCPKRIDCSDLLRALAAGDVKAASAIGCSLTRNTIACLKRDMSPAISMALRDVKRRLAP